MSPVHRHGLFDDVRLLEEGCKLAGALEARQELRERVEQVQEENRSLKVEYDALLGRQKAAEARLREEKVRGGHLLEDMIHLKRQAAAHMNSRNERRSRYLNAPHTCSCRSLNAPHTCSSRFLNTPPLCVFAGFEKLPCRGSCRRPYG